MWNPSTATELRKNEAMQAKQGESNENKVKQACKQTTDKNNLFVDFVINLTYWPFSHRVSNSKSSKRQAQQREKITDTTDHRSNPPKSLSMPLTLSSNSLFFLSNSLISSSSVLKSSSVTSISGSSPTKPNSSS
jgi:hypothetical protein